MGRSGRLAIGVLLLAVAALLESLRTRAAFPTALAVVEAIFAVPGVLLLVSGLRPLRLAPRSPALSMAFVPQRLVGGLALSAGGVAALYFLLPIHYVVPHAVLIGAALAVPLGILAAGSCWTEACPRCRTPLGKLPGRGTPLDGDRRVTAGCWRCGQIALIEGDGPPVVETGAAAAAILAALPDPG